MAASEFHTAAGELQKPLCFWIEILSALAQNTKATTTAGLESSEILSNHIFGNQRAARIQTAQDSKLPTNMRTMKKPESARCPNPQVTRVSGRRTMAKTKLQRQRFGCVLNKDWFGR
jgi:hypothetical protein